MADWNGFKKNGTSYIPNDATARAGVIANTKLIKDTVGWSGKNKCETIPAFTLVKGSERTKNNTIKDTPHYDIYKVSFTISNAANATKQGGVTIGDSAGNWASNYNFNVANGRVEFTIPFNHPVARIYIFLNGEDVDTATATFSDFMITDVDILDQSFEPYFGSTAFPRSEQAVLGAENLFDKTKCDGIDATITQVTNGFKAVVNNHTWGSAKRDFPTPAKNTDFTISCHANVTTAGNFMRIQVYGSDDNNTWTSIALTDFYTTSEDLSLSFNSGNYNYLRMLFYLTNGTATSADVTFENPMLNIGSVALPYVDFAMTNRELTDWVSKLFFATGPYTGDMDDITNGVYYVSNAAAHNPVSNWGFSITMTISNADNRVQLFFPLFSDGIFSRRRNSDGWKDWKSATLSALS